jgi:N-acetylglucosaminyldiphosphoundecaprenol N-acetyl-beta-D-mannosaminyltransferase
MQQPQRVGFLGVDFDLKDTASVVSFCAQRPPNAPFGYIVTPNVDHVVRINQDSAKLDHLYRDALLCLCDSRILRGLAKLSQLDIPVTAGSDLTAELFRAVVQPSDRLTIIGGDAAMIEALKQRFGLTNVRHHNPPMGFLRSPEQFQAAVTFAASHPARFLFLAVGSPQQELLASAIQKSSNTTGLALCIGASLEFLTGAKQRAPENWRRFGFEWLFRLLSEPRRMWRRYLVEGPRVFPLYYTWRRGRISQPSAATKQS